MHYFGAYLGSGLISYAADEQNEVAFDAKILDGEGNEVQEADITSELNLHLSISVTEGSLKNVNLNLDNCNFRLKDKLSIDPINAGETKELDLKIVARNDDKFNLDLLNMESKIKLTGTYLNNNNTEEVNKEKAVSIKWNSANLSTMDEETISATKILENEIITNKTYTIDGEEKRVIQVKVKSGIKDNIYPIERTLITLEPIQIGEISENEEFIKESDIKAEETSVSAYSTMGTNGKDGSVNFGTVEENKLGSWQYDSESGKTTILVNNPKDENNNVVWAKNSIDEFVVTYIFKNEDIKDAKAIRTEIKSEIKLYTEEGEHTKTASQSITNSEKAMLIELNVQNPTELSKKNIQKGKDFNETFELNISNSKIVESILLASELDTLNISDSEATEPATYYKTVYVNKEDFINILGEEGLIELIDINKEEVVGTITKDSVSESNPEILTIEYPEGVSRIGVLISKPIKGGKLSIINSKTLDISSVEEYVAKVDEINLLTINAIGAIGSIYETPIVLKEIALLEPKTNIELGLDLGIDKTTLPVGEENEVNFTVTLHTSKEEDKLFNNPTVQIKLPEQVKESAIIENTENIANANGLELKGIEINNNIIEVKLTGNQEEDAEYNGQDTTITFSAKLKTSELLPTITNNVELTVINGEEEVKDSKQVTFSADKGIILANSISNYNGEEPEILAIKNNSKTGLLSEENSALPQIKGIIINNTGKDLENVVVIGKFAEEASTITPILKEKVTAENASIQYSSDGQTWEEYNAENANTYKSYKITFAKLVDKSITTFTYKIEIPANLGTNKSMTSTYSVKIGEQEGKAIAISLETPQKIELEVVAKSTSDTVYEEQEVTFTVEVTNKSNATAKNVSVEATFPEELELVSKPENFDIEAGKKAIKTITAKVEALPEGAKQKDITTTIKVTPNGKEDQAKTVELKNVVKKALIKAKIEDIYDDGAEFIYEGGQLGYKTTITNISDETLTNVAITSKLPEGTKFNENNENYICVLDGKIVEVEINEEKTENEIKYIIPKLEKNQQVRMEIYLLEMEELSDNTIEKEITYSVMVNTDQIVNYVIEKKDIVVKPKLNFEVTSENLTDKTRNKYVNSGDVLEYIAKIKNNTNFTHTVVFDTNIIKGIDLESISTNIENLEIKKNDKYVLRYNLGPEQELVITWKGTAFKYDDVECNLESISRYYVRIPSRDGFTETKEQEPTIRQINYIIRETTQTDPIEPENPTSPENPIDPEDPTDQETPTEKTYSISGTAWLDENEDGIKDEKERLLKGILVKIKQIGKDNVAQYLKDEDGKEVTAITDNDGKYEFKELKPGKYIIEFEYNTKTYKLTPVTNKDSVPYAPTTSEGTTVTTDTLSLSSKNIENINIGLVLNEKFDLELNKYITRVVVQNNNGTTEYKYNNEQLAKVEIKAKQMASSTVFVEYQIEVKNNGAVPGTASVIADYLPKGLKFNSEMNTNWYQGTDGNLYTEELKDVTLEPGEAKQVKLILTKSMTENNTGTFTNAAEIYEDKNNFGLVDTNSTPANQEQKENDYSKAELLISTATGSPLMYIGIVITSMLILGGRNIPNK